MGEKSDRKTSFARIVRFVKAVINRPESEFEYIAYAPAFKVAVIYLFVSMLWIIVSDTLVDTFLPDSASILWVNLIKGALFVTVTSVFIFFIMSRELKRIESIKGYREVVHAELTQINNLFSSFLESSPDIMVFSLDKDYRYLAFNSRHKYSMLREWGHEIEVGTPVLDVISDRDRADTFKARCDRTLSGEFFTIVETMGKNGEDKSFWQYYFSPVFDRDRKVIALTCFVLNITPLKKAQEQNLYISYHDMLTGLYNRRYCEEAIQKNDIRDSLPISIILGDVNGLKIVNDAFGHRVGDQLLKTSADILKKTCEGRGIVTRWGSDEFMILLPSTDEAEAESLLRKIKLACAKTQIDAVPVDISFGCATKTIEAESILSTIKIAEDQLNRNKIAESKSMRNSIIKTIMHTLHEKSPREEAHSKRVGELCRKIGVAMNMSEVEISQLNLAGFLHDIGKIAIDDRILSKDGKLSESELDHLRAHPEVGCRILRSSYDISEIADAVLFHHERWDGSGYPKGLSGKQIPLHARIIAIADSFDAMTGRRTYRNHIKSEEAAKEIQFGSGTLYDPKVVDIFVPIILTDEWMSEDWDMK